MKKSTAKKKKNSNKLKLYYRVTFNSGTQHYSTIFEMVQGIIRNFYREWWSKLKIKKMS
jgi:hypothetical protein